MCQISTASLPATATYDAGTAQVFGELGYRFDTRVGSFQPFAGLAYVNLDTDGFTEDGGDAALSVEGETTDTTFTTLGLRVDELPHRGDAGDGAGHARLASCLRRCDAAFDP